MNHDDLLNSFKTILEQQDLSDSSITSYLQGIKVFTSWTLDFYQQEVSLFQYLKYQVKRDDTVI